MNGDPWKNKVSWRLAWFLLWNKNPVPRWGRGDMLHLNLQSLEDTQVRYISQKYTLEKYTLEKYTFEKYTLLRKN